MKVLILLFGAFFALSLADVRGDRFRGKVNIITTAGEKDETVNAIIGFFLGHVGQDRLTVFDLDDTQTCDLPELQEALFTERNTTLVIFVSWVIKEPCPFVHGVGSVLQLTDGSSAIRVQFSALNSMHMDFRMKTPVKQDEMESFMQYITYALMSKLSPRTTVNVEEIRFKRGGGDSSSTKPGLSMPVGVLILLCCLACLVVVIVIALIAYQRRLGKKRLNRLKADYVRDRDVAELKPLEPSLGDAANLEFGSKVQEEVPSPTSPFPNNFVENMEKVGQFCVKESQNEDVVTNEEELKLPEKWNVEPASIDTILEYVHDILIKAKAGRPTARHHETMPGTRSLADVVTEALCGTLEAAGVIWETAPAFVELEKTVINWLGSAFGLPSPFRFPKNASDKSLGGGCIQGSTLESTLVALVAAAQQMLSSVSDRKSRLRLGQSLTAYASSEADAAFGISCRLAGIRFRIIPCDDQFRLNSQLLQKEIEKDVASGFQPFFLEAVLGTRSTGAVDILGHLDPVVKKYNLWFHVDAGAGGNSLVCPENRFLLADYHRIQSISISAFSVLLPASMGTFTWCRNRAAIGRAYVAASTLLRNALGGVTSIKKTSYKALKAFTLMRLYGLQGLQHRVRKVNGAASRLKNNMMIDRRLELVGRSPFSWFAFAYKDDYGRIDSDKSYRLCAFINASGEMLVTLAKPLQMKIIRICINSDCTSREDTEETWRVLKRMIDSWEDFEKAGGVMTESECEKSINSGEILSFWEGMESPGTSKMEEGLMTVIHGMDLSRAAGSRSPMSDRSEKSSSERSQVSARSPVTVSN